MERHQRRKPGCVLDIYCMLRQLGSVEQFESYVVYEPHYERVVPPTVRLRLYHREYTHAVVVSQPL